MKRSKLKLDYNGKHFRGKGNIEGSNQAIKKFMDTLIAIDEELENQERETRHGIAGPVDPDLPGTRSVRPNEEKNSKSS